MDNKTLISIQNLAVDFKTERGVVGAVRNISFDIEKGMTTGIVGESGSGKSVSALSIMGLIPSPPGNIRSGKILYSCEGGGHKDLLKLQQAQMRGVRGKDISMIFQEPMSSLNPVFTCGNQVTEAILQHLDVSKKTARNMCLELFEEVRLPRPAEIMRSYPHQLSGGQKQRVMIAMAISCKPSLLIADEPTTALDVTVQKEILGLLLNLQQKHGMGILFITHDLGVISDIASRVIVMYKGEIVESGDTKSIFNNPEHAYTQGLIACRPPLDKRPSKLMTVRDFIDDPEKAKQFLLPENIESYETERKKRQDEIYEKPAILVTESLSTRFALKKNMWGKVLKHVRAVDNVSLDVFPGETLGLVGESGCGKTTLGRTLIRLIENSSGRVIFKGKDISSLKGRELRNLRKQVQIIFQDPYSSLNPRLTIGSAIEEPFIVHELKLNKQKRGERVAELLELVGLDKDFAYRYPHELSGGQRQRACIARALAVGPEFIVCDESVSALDVSVQAQILNLLNKLKREFGLTYIFISHDLSVVRYMSDRMAVMRHGKIVEMGNADEVYSSPKTEYTKTLINAIPGTGNK